MAEPVRPADPDRDAADCARIYAPSVAGSAVSFEEEPPDAAGMATRIARIGRTHPWLVLERDGEVAGYAYACLHRERAAYRWACEVSVYVDAAHRRTGAGRTLYAALFAALRAQRFRTALAGITLPNDASVGLHESLGFTRVAVYPGIGYKAGAWRDVGWWQLDLAPAGAGPPAEVLPPH